MKTLIVGVGGSGKTTLQKRMNDRGCKSILQYTDRQKRNENEDCYHFVTKQHFQKLKSEMVEYETYDMISKEGHNIEVCYGTLLQDLQKDDFVMVISPKMFRSLYDKNIITKDFFIIFLNPSEKIIKQRLEKRYGKGNKEILRRFESDKKDVGNMPSGRIDITITNENF